MAAARFAILHDHYGGNNRERTVFRAQLTSDFVNLLIAGENVSNTLGLCPGATLQQTGLAPL